MKPTQQEIIELAREHGLYLDGINTQLPLYVLKQEELVSLVHLALERFGAGGGEPFAKVESALAYCTGFHARLIPGSRMPKVGTVLYAHPSPSELRAEYLRGLEDAAKICDERAQGLLSIIDLPVVSSPIIQKDRAAQWKDAAAKIRELKGKQ